MIEVDLGLCACLSRSRADAAISGYGRTGPDGSRTSRAKGGANKADGARGARRDGVCVSEGKLRELRYPCGSAATNQRASR